LAQGQGVKYPDLHTVLGGQNGGGPLGGAQRPEPRGGSRTKVQTLHGKMRDVGHPHAVLGRYHVDRLQNRQTPLAAEAFEVLQRLGHHPVVLGPDDGFYAGEGTQLA
jgi:hypothetical protein